MTDQITAAQSAELTTDHFEIALGDIHFRCQAWITGIAHKTQWIVVDGLGGKFDHRTYGDDGHALPVKTMRSMARMVAVEIIAEHQRLSVRNDG